MTKNTLCAQDAYLVLHPQSKKPVGVNWPSQGKSKEEALAAKGNLGLLLGSKSGVMDVDLDCPEANVLADLILPQPFAKFSEGHLTASLSLQSNIVWPNTAVCWQWP